jgi:hemerythrin-like domain-containing protein
MLTTTYSLIVINLEQKITQKMLLALEINMRNAHCNKDQKIDLSHIKTIVSKFVQFDTYFHTRKIEIYVIPAIRKATENVNALLAELDSLSVQAMSIIRHAYEQIQLAIGKENIKVDALFSSMEQYCQNLLRIMSKEEEQLLPVAQGLLTGEEWFSIAVQCMSDRTKD